MMKTDYLGVHEGKYQKLKSEGASGWNSLVLSQDTYQKTTATLQEQGVESGSLLELGCGAGNLALMFAESGYDVHGIDISPTAIAWAEESREHRRKGIGSKLMDAIEEEARHRGYKRLWLCCLS